MYTLSFWETPLFSIFQGVRFLWTAAFAHRPAQENAAPGKNLGAALGEAERSYQAKWAKALFASAMRWTFSRLVIALPSRR